MCGMDEVEPAEVAMDAAIDQLVAKYRQKLEDGEEVSPFSIYCSLESTLSTLFGVDLDDPAAVHPDVVGGIIAVLANVTHRLVKA